MKRRFKALTSAAAMLTAMALTAGCSSITNEETNTYTAPNEMYSVTLPGEWEDGGDFGMPNFLVLTRKDGIQSIIFGMPKNQIFGPTGADVENLEDFLDYADSTFFNGPMMTTELTETEGIALPGALGTVSKEGTATQNNGAKAQIFIECAETDDAYYCFSFSFTKGYDKGMASIRNSLAFEELNIATAEALPNTLRWFNASGAVITKLNNGNLDLVAGYEPSSVMKSTVQGMLTRDWDVSDTASLNETVDWLISEGHNQDVLANLDAVGITGGTREEVLAALEAEGLNANEIIWIMAAYDAKAAYGDSAISGWDYSRAMSMLGWGYLAEYLTYEEAMDKSLEIAQVIQQKFDSWDDYMASYFYGYSYWSEEDLEDPTSDAYRRYQIYEDIKAEDNSVFSIDFKTGLQKEW